jgi:hypothetical protein
MVHDYNHPEQTSSIKVIFHKHINTFKTSFNIVASNHGNTTNVMLSPDIMLSKKVCCE